MALVGIGCVKATLVQSFFAHFNGTTALTYYATCVMAFYDMIATSKNDSTEEKKNSNHQMERRQTRQHTINEKFLCGVAFSIWCYSLSHVSGHVHNAVQSYGWKFVHFHRHMHWCLFSISLCAVNKVSAFVIALSQCVCICICEQRLHKTCQTLKYSTQTAPYVSIWRRLNGPYLCTAIIRFNETVFGGMTSSPIPIWLLLTPCVVHTSWYA